VTPLVAVLVWCACGVIGAMIAQSKNRPPMEGLIWGIALGPIGLLVIASRPRLEPGQTEKPGLQRVREYRPFDDRDDDE